MVNVKKRPVQLGWHLSLKYRVLLMSLVIPSGLDRNGHYRKDNDTLIFRSRALSLYMCVCVLERNWSQSKNVKIFFRFMLPRCVRNTTIDYLVLCLLILFHFQMKGVLPLQCLVCAKLWDNRITLGDVI